MSRHRPEPDHSDLFDQTVAGMARRLRHVRDQEQMMDALRRGMEGFDRAFAATPAAVLGTVACRNGCDACCQVPVDVQAHEVFLAADHIQVNFPPDALAGIIDRLAEHRSRVAAFADGERDDSRLTCPMLQAGSCSIYTGRPEACRSHHASDAAVCAAHIADPSVDLSKVYVPKLRARMFAVMLGMDEAFESFGYDERSYDLGSALHEALTNSLCLVQWMRRQSAFPDSCLAYPNE